MATCKRDAALAERRFKGTLTGRKQLSYDQLLAEYPEIRMEVDARVIRSLGCNESVYLGYRDNEFERVK